MILTFEDTEEEMVNNIISGISNGMTNVTMVNPDRGQRLLFAGLCIDISHRLVIRDNKEIYLTFIEFEILLLLARSAGRVFSKEQIYDLVWKEPYSGDYNIVMSHIRNIREKIEDDPGKPVYIQTMRGVGYRFNKNLSIDQ